VAADDRLDLRFPSAELLDRAGRQLEIAVVDGAHFHGGGHAAALTLPFAVAGHAEKQSA
jgi:hypothetical protein